ncbi:MAG: hypothetical protein U9R50_10375 [Campylobacterota bacterium]|nr:hypothetical protein [Campylobacterota bacterium]
MYVYKPSKKKKLHVKEKEVKIRVQTPSFKKLSDIIKNHASLNTDLYEASELILKHYGVIKAKHGLAPDKDFKRYAEVIFAIATHHNTNKELILMFDKELTRRNPSYKREIEEMLNRGLSARV